ncbi:MAG: response regulator [Proteobacteria bacterium]|nr:response regulator [Pseudomonadota bacterium]
MKCLIVEDNRQDYQLLSRMLMNYGDSDFAENGQDAFEIFKQARAAEEPYDVIFLDIMMPGMDGNEVLRKIREWEKSNLGNGKPVQIVMASSKSDTDTIITSYDDGCQHFFMKPYDKNDLVLLMEKMGFEKTSQSP